MPVNAGVPRDCMLSLTLFLLHISYVLQVSGIHCYAYDITGDALYTGCANIFRESVVDSRDKFVSKIKIFLKKGSDWGRLNLVSYGYKSSIRD